MTTEQEATLDALSVAAIEAYIERRKLSFLHESHEASKAIGRGASVDSHGVVWPENSKRGQVR